MATGAQTKKAAKAAWRGSLDDFKTRLLHDPDPTATPARFEGEAASLASRNQRVQELAQERASLRGGGAEPTEKDFSWAADRARMEQSAPEADTLAAKFADDVPELPPTRSEGDHGAAGREPLREEFTEGKAQLGDLAKIFGGGAAVAGAAGVANAASDKMASQSGQQPAGESLLTNEPGAAVNYPSWRDGGKASPMPGRPAGASDGSLAAFLTRGSEPTNQTPPSDEPETTTPLPVPKEPSKPKAGGGGGKPPAPPKTAEEADTLMASFSDSAKNIIPALYANQGPEARDAFAEELRGIQETFKEAKSDLEKRELGHTLAEALTQMGGAMWGMKTGTDMSALKFKEHDWQKDLALLHDDLKIQLDSLKGRREEAIKKQMHADDMGVKKDDLRLKANVAASDRDVNLKKVSQDRYNTDTRARTDAAQVGATLRGQDLMHDYHLADIASRSSDRNDALVAKKEAAREKLVSDTGKHITEIMSKPAYEKNEEARSQALITALGRIGVPRDEAVKTINEKKWFGLSSGPRDPDEIAAGVNSLMEKYRTGPDAPQIEMVTLVAPDGKTTKTGPATNAYVLEGKGWKRVAQ